MWLLHIRKKQTSKKLLPFFNIDLISNEYMNMIHLSFDVLNVHFDDKDIF
jgi:hypothetical protein